MSFLSTLRTKVFGSKAPERLYFVVRTDLSVGRMMAQAIHAMDEWCSRFGPQQGTVIVYGVPNEEALLALRETLGPKTVMFREPDLGESSTALATSHGPLQLELLGRKSSKSKRGKKVSPRSKRAA